mgnify:CR=1 FL=1
MNNKKIVITGGSGFVGSHVADIFTNNGYNVTIFDNKKSKWIKKDQNFVEGDILDYEKILNTIEGAYAVYHFAGEAKIDESNLKPIDAIRYNILGTTNILEASVKSKIERFVFASTVYVYSEKGGFYKSTKQSCELLTESYHEQYKLNYTILRFGSLYGPRSNKSNGIYEILHQAIKNGKINRKSNGEEVRNYIHVLDAAKACLNILKNEYCNKYVMITGSQKIKIKDLLSMVNEMLDNKIDIKFSNQGYSGHYENSPYTFRPRIADKFIGNSEIELGQGLLDLIYEMYKDINNTKL